MVFLSVDGVVVDFVVFVVGVFVVGVLAVGIVVVVFRLVGLVLSEFGFDEFFVVEVGGLVFDFAGRLGAGVVVRGEVIERADLGLAIERGWLHTFSVRRFCQRTPRVRRWARRPSARFLQPFRLGCIRSRGQHGATGGLRHKPLWERGKRNAAARTLCGRLDWRVATAGKRRDRGRVCARRARGG